MPPSIATLTALSKEPRLDDFDYKIQTAIAKVYRNSSNYHSLAKLKGANNWAK
jgi:hypothetical protein